MIVTGASVFDGQSVGMSSLAPCQPVSVADDDVQLLVAYHLCGSIADAEGLDFDDVWAVMVHVPDHQLAKLATPQGWQWFACEAVRHLSPAASMFRVTIQ